MPRLGPSLIPTAHPIQITEKDELKLLLGLSSYKATGPDQISSRFLKEVATSITQALILMSRDMRFPTMWYVRSANAQTSLRIRAV